jgi:hypothetical protein
MDTDRFDNLVRALTTCATRRTVLGPLVRLPLGAALATLLGVDHAFAEDDDHGSSHRRRQRKTRHKHNRNIVRRNKQHKKHKKLRRKSQPQCTPRGCPAGACGSQPDGCGGTLACSCTGNQPCDQGTCRACDVCQPAGACEFSSVQAAIAATPPRDTIRICPGTYVENAESQVAVDITRDVRLVGAGDGADPQSNTLLVPHHADQTVMRIFGDGQVITVSLEGLRLTGGEGNAGVGLHVLASSSGPVAATLTGCTITNNIPTSLVGGIAATPGTQVTLVDTHITGNTGTFAGGIFAANGQVALDTLSRVTGNTATVADGAGGIMAEFPAASVHLPSVDNVTGNTSPGANKNCRGNLGGTFTGLGAICTMT